MSCVCRLASVDDRPADRLPGLALEDVGAAPFLDTGVRNLWLVFDRDEASARSACERPTSRAKRRTGTYPLGLVLNRQRFSIRPERPTQRNRLRAKKPRFFDQVANDDRCFWYYVGEVCSNQMLQVKKSMSTIALTINRRSARPSRLINVRCESSGSRTAAKRFCSSSRQRFSVDPIPSRADVVSITASLDGTDSGRLRVRGTTNSVAGKRNAGRSLICRRYVGKARRGANRGNVQKGHKRRK